LIEIAVNALGLEGISNRMWAGISVRIEAVEKSAHDDVGNMHSLVFTVRDYECDLQGVVNNAVYLNYLEHARHEFLKSHGVDFAVVTRQGIHLVVVRAELDYKASLTPSDEFSVTTRFEREGKLKIVFFQEIIRHSEQALMLTAKITATAINEAGRPFVPEDILASLAD
jgi:acyl-CoA thioester hydrolase